MTPRWAATSGTRRAPELLRELAHRRPEPQVQLLSTARRPDRPGLVAKVALQLAFDRRGRERGELEIATGIETFDGFEQPDEGHLFQIIELFATIREAARDMCGKALVGLDELVSELPLARPSIFDELRSLQLSRFGAHARDAYPGRRVQVKHTFPSAIPIV